MKKLNLCILLLAASCFAQDGPNRPLSLTGSQCGSVSVEGKATVAVLVSGSWSGTIQPEVALGGQAAVNTQVTPSTSTTPQATITANGAYTTSTAGFTVFLVCGNTITGTAKVFINVARPAH
jgi:hypothetical protein